jgi:hypothetical protein
MGEGGNMTVQEELTEKIAKYVAEKADEFYKSGFYAGQAIAGISLDECHENWKKLTELKKEVDDVK